MLLIILFLILKIFIIVDCSHFRGGSISARPVKDLGSNVTMEFYLSLCWRRDASNCFCDDAKIDSQALIGDRSDIQCTSDCNGQTFTIGDALTYCSSYSIIDNWSCGQKTFQYTLPKNCSYKAIYSGNAWLALTINGNSDWNLQTSFNTFIRDDTNDLNESPRPLLPPVLNIRSNTTLSFKLPIIDPNDDEVKCRKATGYTECGSICNSLPDSSLTSDCILNFDSIGKENQKYGVAIQIEDYINSNSSTPMSSIPLQFLINPKLVNTTCNTEPTLESDRNTLICDITSTYQIMKLKITARTNCSDENVTIDQIQVNGPLGVRSSLLTSESNDTWSKIITWQPNKNQLGKQLICAMAIDSTYLRAFDCFKITVIETSPLRIISYFPKDTIDLTLLTRISNITEFYFVITFNLVEINKAIDPAFIRIFKESNNVELTSFDTSLIDLNSTISTSDISMHMNNLVFKLPISMLEMNTWYYILVDTGITYINESCLIFNDPISNKSDWRFRLLNQTTIVTTTTTTSTTTTTTLSTTTTKASTTMTSATTTNNVASIHLNQHSCNTGSFVFVLIFFFIFLFYLVHHIIIIVVFEYIFRNMKVNRIKRVYPKKPINHIENEQKPKSEMEIIKTEKQSVIKKISP